MPEIIDKKGQAIHRVKIGNSTYLVSDKQLLEVQQGIHAVRESQGIKDDPESVASQPLQQLSDQE